MAMNKVQAERALARMINIIGTLFYQGLPPTAFGSVILPKITAITHEGVPNANLGGIGDTSYGVEVTKELLDIRDNTTIEFGLAHELGHAFSEEVLSQVGLAGVSGEATEVIA